MFGEATVLVHHEMLEVVAMVTWFCLCPRKSAAPVGKSVGKAQEN